MNTCPIKNENTPVAVIGAGPVGLVAAAHLEVRGIPFLLFEAGTTVASHILSWRHIQLIAPTISPSFSIGVTNQLTSIMEETTDIFGIPVPSTDATFLSFVVVHILISLIAVLAGLLAMLSDKRRGRHSFYGRVYLWAMLSSFCTVVILSVMRWPHNIHLLFIGGLAISSTLGGYWLARHRGVSWTRFHTICMGISYILLMTGFYVDNGKNLPFWKLFPQWFFWVFPAVVGMPIIIYALRTNPLNRNV